MYLTINPLSENYVGVFPIMLFLAINVKHYIDLRKEETKNYVCAAKLSQASVQTPHVFNLVFYDQHVQ